MGWFGLFKKIKKEESEMTEDEKEIKEAKKDIAEKGKDSQTEKDRIDESVGEQERRSGDENSQNAKDRVDESEGAKKADEKRAEEKQEESKTDVSDTAARLDKLISVMERFVGAMEKRAEHVAEAAEGSKLNGLAEKYGMPSAAGGETAKKSFTDDDVKKLLG